MMTQNPTIDPVKGCQVFIYLPFSDLERCVSVLRPEELVDQRRDIIKVLNYMLETNDQEPIDAYHLTMWRDNEVFLCNYGLMTCEELIRRGRFDNASIPKLAWLLEAATSGNFNMAAPTWLGLEIVHRKHREELLKIDRNHYAREFARGA